MFIHGIASSGVSSFCDDLRVLCTKKKITFSVWPTKRYSGIIVFLSIDAFLEGSRALMPRKAIITPVIFEAKSLLMERGINIVDMGRITQKDACLRIATALNTVPMTALIRVKSDAPIFELIDQAKKTDAILTNYNNLFYAMPKEFREKHVKDPVLNFMTGTISEKEFDRRMAANAPKKGDIKNKYLKLIDIVKGT